VNITTHDVIIAVLFLVIGWFLHILWDVVCDWIADVTDSAHSLLYDVFAIIGVVAVAVAIGYAVTH
jgi:hypothetical protein